MSRTRESIERVREWQGQYRTLRGNDPEHIHASNGAPLLMSDIEQLLIAAKFACDRYDPPPRIERSE